MSDIDITRSSVDCIGFNGELMKHKDYSLLLINGYIRDFEKKFKNVIIPYDIIIICLHFYFIDEYFNSIPHGVISSDNNKTITMQCHSTRSIFGNFCIESKSQSVCLWTIKVHQSYNMIIGISSEWTSNDKDFILNTASSNYGYDCYGYTYTQKEYAEYGSEWRHGDVIEMKLDLKQGMIEYYKNGKSEGIAFKQIDINDNLSYKLAVNMDDRYASLTIVKCEYLE